MLFDAPPSLLAWISSLGWMDGRRDGPAAQIYSRFSPDYFMILLSFYYWKGFRDVIPSLTVKEASHCALFIPPPSFTPFFPFFLPLSVYDSSKLVCVSLIVLFVNFSFCLPYFFSILALSFPVACLWQLMYLQVKISLFFDPS